MNKAVYDRLPRELKTVFDDNSGQPAAGMAGSMWDLQAASVADSVAQRGDVITTLLPEAVAHWRKATEPALAVWLKEMKERKVDGGKTPRQRPFVADEIRRRARTATATSAGTAAGGQHAACASSRGQCQRDAAG